MPFLFKKTNKLNTGAIRVGLRSNYTPYLKKDVSVKLIKKLKIKKLISKILSANNN